MKRRLRAKSLDRFSIHSANNVTYLSAIGPVNPRSIKWNWFCGGLSHYVHTNKLGLHMFAMRSNYPEHRGKMRRISYLRTNRTSTAATPSPFVRTMIGLISISVSELRWTEKISDKPTIAFTSASTSRGP